MDDGNEYDPKYQWSGGGEHDTKNQVEKNLKNTSKLRPKYYIIIIIPKVCDIE